MLSGRKIMDISPPPRDLARVFIARPDLDMILVPALRAMPYFRLATTAEIERTFAAYQSGDIDELCTTWAAEAEPTRADIPPAMRAAYAQAGRAPRLISSSIFLDSVRAALRAGERFRDALPRTVRDILHTEFPYLERRHEHVPLGTPAPFEFPAVFAAYLDPSVLGPEPGDLDDTRARWQLAVALNEVQQWHYSRFAAQLFRLPELERHAARERALATNYFAHWSPQCTLDLWRETIYVLDSLNAATFELVCEVLIPQILSPRALITRAARKRRWQAFVAGLDQPQWLMPPE